MYVSQSNFFSQCFLKVSFFFEARKVSMSWVNLLALAKKGLNILEYERLTLVFKTLRGLGFAIQNVKTRTRTEKR